MMHYAANIAAFGEPFHEEEHVGVDRKIDESMQLLRDRDLATTEVLESISPEDYISGEAPRLSPFDIELLPKGTKLRALNQKLLEYLARESSQDRMDWNTPASFLSRLVVSREVFVRPIPGNSRVLDRLNADGRVVGFSNIAIKSPPPQKDRHSRKAIDETIDVHNIMGMARLPIALGSVPDIGSVLGYMTVAQSNGMSFIARDKVLAETDHQVDVVSRVIEGLSSMPIPDSMLPSPVELGKFGEITGMDTRDYSAAGAQTVYIEKLRESWIANVGAAIEASSKGIERAKRLQDAGCNLLRIYSPEGGLEIVQRVEELRGLYDENSGVKIVAGQMMDANTARDAEVAGADALIIGSAGGSQCTTSKNAGIPVNTPNFLYDLRGKINIPIGIEGGGVGDHLMPAFALGASFLLKPGEIGMSIEGAGAKYMLQDPDSNYWMLYGGEASDSSKWWRHLVDKQGRPKFVEGEPGLRKLPRSQYSMTRNIRKLRDQIAIGLVFQRAHTIAELHQRDCSNIVEVTPEAAQLSYAYGQ